MALPTASDNKWPKLFMEEVANDGSATTTPAADHRAFFVGEDGLFHLKDSSGTVTTPSASSGAVTSSLLTMATARLLGRTTASTGAIEEITVGSGLSLAAGALTATGGGGGGVVHAIASRTSGNLSLTSTSEANLDTGLDLTVAAATGDIITVNINGLHDNSSKLVNLDVATIVSAAPVNYFGVGLASTAQGLLGWSKQDAVFTPITGSMTYVVQAGDISGGNVVLRLRYKVNAATSIIYATTDLLFRWSATVQTP